MPVPAWCKHGLVEEEACTERAQDLCLGASSPLPHCQCQHLTLLGTVCALWIASLPAVETEAREKAPDPEKRLWLERGLWERKPESQRRNGAEQNTEEMTVASAALHLGAQRTTRGENF